VVAQGGFVLTKIRLLTLVVPRMPSPHRRFHSRLGHGGSHGGQPLQENETALRGCPYSVENNLSCFWFVIPLCLLALIK